MNRRVRVIVRNEFMATARRRAFIVTTLLIPALAAVALIIYAGVRAASPDPEPRDLTYGYVDHSGVMQGTHRIDDATFQPMADRDAGVAALLDEEIALLIEIPPDYLATGVVVQVEERRGGLPGFGTDTPPVDRLLAELLLEGRIPTDVRDRVLDPVTIVTQQVDAQGRPVDEPFDPGRLAFFLAVAALAIVSALMTSGFFQEGLSEEKENRIMEVLLSSATPRDLMLGKLLGLGGVGLAQFAFWVVCGGILLIAAQVGIVGEMPEAITDLALPPLPLIVVGLLFFLLGYALLGSLMASVGAITTTHREAQQVSFLVILPYLVPLWVITPLLQSPEGTLSRALTFIPLTAPVTAMVRLGTDGIGAGELALSLAVLGLATLAALLSTVRVFEISLLMYGQRPKAGQIARAIVRPGR